MFDTVVTGIGVLLALLLAGFMTPTIIVYGGVATGILAIGAPLMPSFSRTDIFTVMFFRLLAMFTVFPRALGGVASVMPTDYGLLGVHAVNIVDGLLSATYRIRILCGSPCWAEPNVLPTIVHLSQ